MERRAKVELFEQIRREYEFGIGPAPGRSREPAACRDREPSAPTPRAAAMEASTRP